MLFDWRYVTECAKVYLQTSGKDADGIDWSQAIFFQVGNLHERYWSWVHEPIDLNMRLFKSDFCEYFTRNNWLISLIRFHVH